MSRIVQQIPLEKEYEKNRDISPEDIKKLREWLKTQPHLPEQYITDLDILLAFYCCERSAEVTKQVLDLHFTLRTLFTAFFKDRAMGQREELCLNTVLLSPLPTPTAKGYRAVYARLLDPDPRNFFFNDVIRAFMMMFDLWQYEEGTWPGFVLIIDMDLSVLAHIGRLEIMTVKQMLYFLQECMLVKLKEVHFLNAPPFMDKLMMLLKPFMKKSLMDIIHIHHIGADTVYKFIPKSAFPVDEGGEYKDHNTIRDDLIALFRANTDFIRDENCRRVKETLRPGGQSGVEEEFGIQGSFKKLDID